MSFKPYTEKIKKKKIGICSILGRIRIRIQNRTRIRIHHPGSRRRIRIHIKMIRIRNTGIEVHNMEYWQYFITLRFGRIMKKYQIIFNLHIYSTGFPVLSSCSILLV